VWRYAIGILIALFSIGDQQFHYNFVGGFSGALPLVVFAVPLVFLLRGQRTVARWRLVLFGGAALTILYAAVWVDELMTNFWFQHGWWRWLWWGLPTYEIMMATYVTLLAVWQMRLSRAQTVPETQS